MSVITGDDLRPDLTVARWFAPVEDDSLTTGEVKQEALTEFLKWLGSYGAKPIHEPQVELRLCAVVSCVAAPAGDEVLALSGLLRPAKEAEG